MSDLPKGIEVKPFRMRGHENEFCDVSVQLPGSSMDSTGMVDRIRLHVSGVSKDKAIGEAVGVLLAIAKEATRAAEALRLHQSTTTPLTDTPQGLKS